MVRLFIKHSARHLVITPNRSLDDSLVRAHNRWLTTLMLMASLAFLLLGLWPISAMFVFVVLGFLYSMRQVHEMLKSEERLIIGVDKLEIRHRGRVILYKGAIEDASIRVTPPRSTLDRLVFELVAPQRPALMLAKNISQKDCLALLATLKDCDLKVNELSGKDRLVKSF